MSPRNTGEYLVAQLAVNMSPKNTRILINGVWNSVHNTICRRNIFLYGVAKSRMWLSNWVYIHKLKLCVYHNVIVIEVRHLFKNSQFYKNILDTVYKILYLLATFCFKISYQDLCFKMRFEHSSFQF